MLALVVALMVTGCGGDGTGRSIDFRPGLEIPGLGDEVLAAAEALAADVGDDAVFGAVAVALDRGYTVAQLVEAAGKGIVTRDGLIEGAEPAGELFGLILGSDSDAGGNAFPIVLAAPQLMAAEWADPVTADELEEAMASSRDFYDLDVAGRESIALVGALLHLVDMGYSFDQVVEGLVFGELDVAWTPDYERRSGEPCIALVDGRRKVVMPEGDAGGAVTRSIVCANLARSLVATDSPANQPGESPGSSDSGQTTTSAAAVDPVGDIIGAFRLEGSMLVSGDGATLSATWSGEFDLVDDVTVVGSGTGIASSEGACRINEGPEHVYAFTVSWDFMISGSVEGESMQLVLTPEQGTSELSTGDGTQVGEFCVGFARDFLIELAESPIGAEPPLEIVVPASGGATRVGVDPFGIDITVQKVEQ